MGISQFRTKRLSEQSRPDDGEETEGADAGRKMRSCGAADDPVGWNRSNSGTNI